MDYPPVLDDKMKPRGPLRCEGVGGMLLADTIDGRRVAVRWFPPGSNGEEAISALLAMPTHRALPMITGTGRELVCDWAAIDYPDGQLLEASEPLTEQQLIELGGALAGALAALHGAGIYHGELAMDSVLMPDGGGVPRLFDVPTLIANRVTDRRGEARNLAQLARTVSYLAPERAVGAPPSPASDVYSLAAVLCAAASPRVTPKGSALERLHQVALGLAPIVPPPALSEPVRELLAAMLSLDVNKRPAASDVLGRLIQMLQAQIDAARLAAASAEEAAQPAEVAPPAEAVAPLDAVAPQEIAQPPLTLPEMPAIELAPAVELPLVVAATMEAAPAPAPQAKVDVPWQDLPEADPFEALVASQPMTANDLHPGHEPTLQEHSPPVILETPMIVADVVNPPVVIMEPSTPVVIDAPPAEAAAPVLAAASTDAEIPIAMRPTPPKQARKSGPKKAVELDLAATQQSIPPPMPTAPVAARPTLNVPAPPTLDFAQPSKLPAGVLAWFAASNARMGALIGAASLTLLVAVTMLGEYQSRRSDYDAMLERPRSAAAAAKEKQKQLEETPPPPSPADLRKASQETPDEY